MKRVGLFVKEEFEAEKTADELEKWLVGKGVEVLRKRGMPSGLKKVGEKIPSAPQDLFCIFVDRKSTRLNSSHYS